jgi:hypothetical protein
VKWWKARDSVSVDALAQFIMDLADAEPGTLVALPPGMNAWDLNTAFDIAQQRRAQGHTQKYQRMADGVYEVRTQE